MNILSNKAIDLFRNKIPFSKYKRKQLSVDEKSSILNNTNSNIINNINFNLNQDNIQKEKEIKMLLKEKSNIFHKSIYIEKEKENKKKIIPISVLTKESFNSDDYNIIRQI